MGPGPDDLEHRSAGDLGGAARQHRGSYTRALQPALDSCPPQRPLPRASITQAAQLARRLPSNGPVLRAAAGPAFLHGMSIVMLICAAITAFAALASLRYLPGRATLSPARQPPVTASPPAGTRR